MGGVVLLADFLHAFSYWSYVHTNRKLLVSDLQGILNEGGTHPKFELTDPAICSQRSGRNRFGRTDGGSWGCSSILPQPRMQFGLQMSRTSSCWYKAALTTRYGRSRPSAQL